MHEDLGYVLHFAVLIPIDCMEMLHEDEHGVLVALPLCCKVGGISQVFLGKHCKLAYVTFFLQVFALPLLLPPYSCCE